MKFLVNILFALVAFSANAQTNYWGQNVGGYQGSVYAGQQAMQASQIRIGTVLDMRPVQIVQTPQGMSYGGAATGATVGGLIGSQMGHGSGRTAAVVIMSALGGLAGERIGNEYNTQRVDAVEVVVKMESGEVMAITQGIDGDARSIRVGDRVRLIQSQGWGGNVRVARVGPNGF